MRDSDEYLKERFLRTQHLNLISHKNFNTRLHFLAVVTRMHSEEAHVRVSILRLRVQQRDCFLHSWASEDAKITAGDVERRVFQTQKDVGALVLGTYCHS